jgi:hypothetical protein
MDLSRGLGDVYKRQLMRLLSLILLVRNFLLNTSMK